MVFPRPPTNSNDCERTDRIPKPEPRDSSPETQTNPETKTQGDRQTGYREPENAQETEERNRTSKQRNGIRARQSGPESGNRNTETAYYRVTLHVRQPWSHHGGRYPQARHSRHMATGAAGDRTTRGLTSLEIPTSVSASPFVDEGLTHPSSPEVAHAPPHHGDPGAPRVRLPPPVLLPRAGGPAAWVNNETGEAPPARGEVLETPETPEGAWRRGWVGHTPLHHCAELLRLLAG